MNDFTQPRTTSASVFRQSIWEERHDYRFHDCSTQQLDNLARVYNLMAAKLNIPFPTLDACQQLIAATEAVPDTPASIDDVTISEHLETYLDAATGIPGIGIPTAICMLAVEKGGAYAPMDKKVASGLFAGGIVTDAEVKALTGNKPEKFVRVYVEKVMARWQAERLCKSPREVDEGWASANG